MNEIPDLNRSSSLPARVFGWLFSRRILRRLLLGFAALITFTALAYAEENWRGGRAWEAYKHAMAARGETLDWSAYIPAPVPDDQNVFKAPKMAEWFLDQRALSEAPLDHPITNDFARQLINPKSIVTITNASEAANYLAWSDQFQPDFDTIATALKRPAARIVDDYTHPLLMQFPNAVTGREVIRTLEQRAKCHLLLGQTDKAWQELTLINDLRRLVDAQGEFLTTEGDWMIRGIIYHSVLVVARGIQLHAWREPELRQLQQQLESRDVLAQHAHALRCGRALLFSAVESGEIARGYSQRSKTSPVSLAPHGTLEQMFIRKSDDIQQVINVLTPTNGIVRPGELSQASAWWKRAQEGMPAVLRVQTLINEGQIACALERYRLAHGGYPESLDALVPAFIQQVPRDIVNGQSLKYRRNEDGTFLLYSVGWNETDENGNDVSDPSHPETLKDGDWSWLGAAIRSLSSAAERLLFAQS